MTHSLEVALLIPALNAADSLGGVLEEVHLHGLPILVVDDGSTDDTLAVAEKGLVWKVVSHPQNRGKGAALGLPSRESSLCLDRGILSQEGGGNRGEPHKKGLPHTQPTAVEGKCCPGPTLDQTFRNRLGLNEG